MIAIREHQPFERLHARGRGMSHLGPLLQPKRPSAGRRTDKDNLVGQLEDMNMGEIHEMIIEGTLCQECAQYMGGDAGFLRTRPDCLERADRNDADQFACGQPGCNRRFATMEECHLHQMDADYHRTAAL